MMEKYAKNTILYGPPGTGKTFHIRKRAVDICVGGEYQKGDTPKANQAYNEKYEELLNEDRIRFITFHQSYGYEDFIEGIRPVMDGKAGELKYEIRDGVFKEFCQPNPTWIINASDNQKNFQYPDWFKENVIKLSDVASSGQDAMQRKMRKGDYAVILDRKDKAHYLAVGFCRILEDEPSKKKDESSIKEWFERKVEWLWKVSDNKDGIDLKKDNPNLKINRDLYICNDKIDLNLPTSFLPKVFIIDEINRGNISKIFGELITLIEDDKRIGAENEMNTILPYSGDSFSVPENVCLLGTMNTADRSIALLDTALRRRFTFEEMMPDPEKLHGVEVNGVKIDELLAVMNKRIEVLLDREHQIGHAYFLPLKKEPTIDKLAEIFEKKIIPLLQEYFYDDYEKIRMALNDNGIIKKEATDMDLFNGFSDVDLPEAVYMIDKAAMKDPESYKMIYNNSKNK